MKLRRIALGAQGLLHKQPFGRGLNGALRAIQHIGYVQLDTISVVERAHHHVLYSRVPGYQPQMLNTLHHRKAIFEYWSHAAAFLPIDHFRYSLRYKHAIKAGQTHWHKTPDRRLMAEILEKIREEGPLRSRDLESQATKKQGWWDWKPTKKAIEQLYMEGEVMVSDREGFQKTYDLTERVLPNGIDTTEPTPDEFAEHLLQQQLTCHGLVSLKGLTYLRRDKALRIAVKKCVEHQLDIGELLQVALKNGEQYYVQPEDFESSPSPLPSRLQILSPFDNSVIQRDRLASLFDYDYQIECYVPAPKRQFGYFCLPLLYKGHFVGRVDCKAHRKEKRLEIKSLAIESNEFALDELASGFGNALQTFCQFQGCETVDLPYEKSDFMLHLKQLSPLHFH